MRHPNPMGPIEFAPNFPKCTLCRRQFVIGADGSFTCTYCDQCTPKQPKPGDPAPA